MSRGRRSVVAWVLAGASFVCAGCTPSAGLSDASGTGRATAADSNADSQGNDKNGMSFTQHMGDETIVLVVSKSGTLTSVYASSDVSATPMAGGAVRYSDETVLVFDYVHRTYTSQPLADALATQSTLGKPPQFATGTAVTTTNTPLAAVDLHTKIAGIQAHAYTRTDNGVTSRLWFADELPKAPEQVRSLIVNDSEDDATSQTAGLILLRSELLVDGKWQTSLDTSSIQRNVNVTAGDLGPPSGLAQVSPPAAPANVATPAGTEGTASSSTVSGASPPVATAGNFGGPLLESPQVQLYFYGSIFAQPANADGVGALTDAFATMLGPAAMSRLSEYGIGSGALVRSFVNGGTPPYQFGADQSTSWPLVGGYVTSLMQTNGPSVWWNGNPAPLYIVVVNSADVAKSTKWVGYHSIVPALPAYLPFPLLLFGQPFMPFAIVKVSADAVTIPGSTIPYRDYCFTPNLFGVGGSTEPPGCSQLPAFDDATSTASHEIYEAASDPIWPLGYTDFRKPTDSDELCDICDENPHERTSRVGNIVVEDVWSNESHDCIAPYAPTITILQPIPGATYEPGQIPLAADVTTAIDRGIQLDSDVTWSTPGGFFSQVGVGQYTSANITTLGDHTITATVTDANGYSASASVPIHIALIPPTVGIDAPADGATIPLGGYVHLEGHGSDYQYSAAPDSMLSWTVNGQPAGTGSDVITQFTTAGDNTIALTITDPFNLTATDSRVVHVTAGDGVAIAITSPADQWNCPEYSSCFAYEDVCGYDYEDPCPITVSLAATAVDENGNALSGSSIVWSATSISLYPTIPIDAQIGTGTTFDWDVNWTAGCTYEWFKMTATATSASGATATDSVRIKVGGHGC